MYSFYYSEFIKKSNEKINYIVTPVGPIIYNKPQVSHLITLPIPIYYLTEEEQDLLSSQVIMKFPYIYSCPIPLEKHQEITEKQNYLMDNLINYGSFLPNIQQTQQSQDFQQKKQNYQMSTENPQMIYQKIESITTSNEKAELNNLSETKENICLKFQNSSVFNNFIKDQQKENENKASLSQHNEFQYPSFFSYNNFRNQIINNNNIKNDKNSLQEHFQHQPSNQQPITPQSTNQQSTTPQQLFNFKDLYDFQIPNNFLNNNH